jgi:hypothetical protein
MRHIVLLLLLLFFSETLSQELTVADSKKATYLDGQIIQKGDTINTNGRIRIARRGKLGLRLGRSTFNLKRCNYDMDSVLRQRITREYLIDDSIYSIMRNENVLDCKKTGFYCMTYRRLTNPNYRQADHMVLATGDSVKLNWEERPDHKGVYYVVFATVFEDLIHIEITDKNALNFNLLPFKREKAILYKVVSKGCIESDWMLIRRVLGLGTRLITATKVWHWANRIDTDTNRQLPDETDLHHDFIKAHGKNQENA